VALERIFGILDAVYDIDARKNEGFEPEAGNFRGEIEFKNVCFNYPSRPD
jgi:ABC-type multidrug transport system fused ATPase/permease subunit